MEQAKNPRSPCMLAAVTVMFLVAAGVTVAAAFLFVEKDRGFLFWLTTGFVLLAETVAYAFTIGLFASRLRKDQVSTPIIVASWVVLVIYAFVGTASIVIYTVIRDADNPNDKAFAAVLLIETALAFVLVLLLRAWDLFFQAGRPPVAARREENRAKGIVLQPLIERLRTLACPDPAGAIRIDKIAKRLEVVQSGLLHSHGGGIGSREAGRTHALDPATEGEMIAILAQLETAVRDIQTGEGLGHRIDEIEPLVEHLQGFASALQLD